MMRDVVLSRAKRLMLIVLCGGLLFSLRAFAANTSETWQVGSSHFEASGSVGGLGSDKDVLNGAGDMVLGYGLLPRFSAYLGASLAARRRFSNSTSTLFIGATGTVLDTDHFDVDLMMRLQVQHGTAAELMFIPGIEVNFDLDPQMRTWGAYLRIHELMEGRDKQPDDPSAGRELVFTTKLTLGTYYTIGNGHQVLLEVLMDVAHTPAVDQAEFEFGGVALGYNKAFGNGVELVTQIYFDIPQSNEKFTVALMGGLIIDFPMKK